MNLCLVFSSGIESGSNQRCVVAAKKADITAFTHNQNCVAVMLIVGLPFKNHPIAWVAMQNYLLARSAVACLAPFADDIEDLTSGWCPHS